MISIEVLAGGRVTTRDPSFLERGECVAIQNGIYRYGDPSLWRIPGYITYDRPVASAVHGLATCRFNDGSHYLLSQADSKLWIGDIAPTGTMASATASNGTGSLAAAQFGNRYYIFNGADAPMTLLQDGTIRQCGMAPVDVGLDTLTTATGTFNGDAPGYYDYWITEVYISDAATEMANSEGKFYLESAYTAKPQTINIPTSLAARVAITLPTAKVNAIATHWRIYRGGPKTAKDDTIFPLGYQVIDDIEISDASYGSVVYDGSTANTAFTVPGAVVSASGWGSSGGGATVLADVTATGGNYASVTATAGAGDLVYGSFSFASLADPINGIEVQIRHSQSGIANIGAYVYLSFDGGTTWAPTRYRVSPRRSGVWTTSTYGGPAEKWGAAFITVTNMAAGNFQVKIVPDGNQVVAHLSIDYVAVNVYYNGAISPDDLYNAIIIDSASVQGAVSGAGLPPVASVATTFEGMLVCDDVAVRNQLRYSQADQPEYWPSLYYLNLETDENDTVTFLGTVNNRLIVGQAGAIIRVNYLPTESDADFRRGVVWEHVSKGHGVINRRCATVFTGPDGRQLMAFISYNGLYATDGYTITQLSENIDWFTDIVVGQSNPANVVLALVEDSSTHTLWVYLRSGVAYIYHYLTKTWTGPCYITASGDQIGGVLAVRGSIGKVMHYVAVGSGSNAGTVYSSDTSDYCYSLAGTGYTHLRTGSKSLVVTTRDIHPGGLGNEAPIKWVGVMASKSTTVFTTNLPMSVTMSADLKFSNAADVVGQALDPVTALGKYTVVPVGDINADAISLTIVAAADTVATPVRIMAILLGIGDGRETTVA